MQYNKDTEVNLFCMKGGCVMERYSVWEGHMDDLMKKVNKIQNKCRKFGCDFHFAQVGDRVDVQIASVKCITSWESCFNGYSTTSTYVWKITDVNGNIFTWKTSKWMDEENPPASMKGTVKEHKMFREVKQTELTRCKVA